MLSRWLSLVCLLGGLSLAGYLLTQRTGATWGTFHEPHNDSRVLRLSTTVAYEQTIQPEFGRITGFLLLLEPPTSREGTLVVDIEQGTQHRQSSVPLTTVSTTGEVFIPLGSLSINKHALVRARVHVKNAPKALGLRYEIDATKYAAGELWQTTPADGTTRLKQGDLAFRVRYQPSTLERMHVPLGAALIAAVLIVLTWYILARWPDPVSAASSLRWQRLDTLVVIGIIIFLGGFILVHFDVASFTAPTAQGDETKNLLYLNSTVIALQSWALPHWHHTTCGGQPLMGNPEAPTVGLAPLLGLLFGVSGGFKLLVIAEVVILAIGLYVLSRYLGLLLLPSLLPALVMPLSGYVVNRILIGHTMFTGGLTFTPWIMLTYLLALRSRWWAVVCGALMAGALYRGDTHSLFYTLILLVIWGVVLAVQQRNMRPLFLGILAGLVFFVVGAGKIIPVLEGTSHFNGDALPPMVVLLTKFQLWDDVFLDRSIHTKYLTAEVVGAAWEDWENIGLYTGSIPILLAIGGLMVAPRHLRILLGTTLLFFLILGEGSLYHYALRHIPYIESILRLPSRTLSMAILTATLAGGFGLQRLLKNRLGPALAVITLLIAVIDVGSYARQTLGRLEFAAPQPHTVDAVPKLLEAHPHIPGMHLLTIARRNSVAPGSCQDFNVFPTFDTTPGTPLITTNTGTPVAATLSPNHILIPPSGSSELVVRVMDSPLLSVTNGERLPMTSAGLPIITTAPTQPVILSYGSPSTAAGAAVSLGGAVSLVLLWWGQHRRPTNISRR